MLAVFYFMSTLVLFRLEQYLSLYFYCNLSKSVESLRIRS